MRSRTWSYKSKIESSSVNSLLTFRRGVALGKEMTEGGRREEAA
jgi:hypothetical protein